MTVNFYLHDHNSKKCTTIFLRFRYPNGLLVCSTKNSILPSHWNKQKKRAKEIKSYPQYKELNTLLNKFENETYNSFRHLINSKQPVSNSTIKKELFHRIFGISKTPITDSNKHSFLPLLKDFINDMKTGKRVQSNGKKVADSTIQQYQYSLNYLADFQKSKQYPLQILSYIYTDHNNLKKYYTEFYHHFTEYLYNDRKHYDNSVGHVIKHIKCFFSYLNQHKNINTGDFYRSFYVRREDIPVLVIEPDQLNYLITNKDLESSLDYMLQKAKDYFVIGCTVALRVSDLKSLTPDNLIHDNGNVYLVTTSKKTGVSTKIKLPQYAIDIFNKYKDKHSTLLPPTNLQDLNSSLKQLGKLCKWNKPIIKTRERRGQKVTIYKNENTKANFQLSDLISMHCARRTAITTLLRLGVPENVVKSISGHSQNSASFHKYIAIAESYKNEQYTTAIDKLLTLS